MESNLTFDKKNDIDGTHFLAYLYVNKKSRDCILQYDYSKYKYDRSSFPRSWTFQNIIGRINNLSNQNIFGQSDEEKLSFSLDGTYKNEPFNLYDWKGDKCVHIGGNDKLDVEGLRTELIELIKKTEPKSYTAICYYDGRKYSYKDKTVCEKLKT